MSEQFQTQVHHDGVAEVVLSRPPVNALNAAGCARVFVEHPSGT